MKKTLLSIIAAGLFSAGCASFESEGQLILKVGDTFEGNTVCTIHRDDIFKDKHYNYTVEVKKGNKIYYATMNKDGTGLLSLTDREYRVEVDYSDILKERRIILSPIFKK